jgi:hypothetical protein
MDNLVCKYLGHRYFESVYNEKFLYCSRCANTIHLAALLREHQRLYNASELKMLHDKNK